MRSTTNLVALALTLLVACTPDGGGSGAATSSVGSGGTGGAAGGGGESTAGGAGGAGGTTSSGGGAGGGPECFVRTGAKCPPGTGMIRGTAVDVERRCWRVGEEIALCTTRGEQTATGCLVDPTTGTTYVVDGIACRDGHPWVACSAEVEDRLLHDGNAIADCADAGG